MQGSTCGIESSRRAPYSLLTGAGGVDVAEEWRVALVSLTEQMNANHVETIKALGEIRTDMGRVDQKLESHISESDRRFVASAKTLGDHIETCPEKPSTSKAVKAGWWSGAIVGLGGLGKFIAEHWSKAD